VAFYETHFVLGAWEEDSGLDCNMECSPKYGNGLLGTLLSFGQALMWYQSSYPSFQNGTYQKPQRRYVTIGMTVISMRPNVSPYRTGRVRFPTWYNINHQACHNINVPRLHAIQVNHLAVVHPHELSPLLKFRRGWISTADGMLCFVGPPDIRHPRSFRYRFR